MTNLARKFREIIDKQKDINSIERIVKKINTIVDNFNEGDDNWSLLSNLVKQARELHIEAVAAEKFVDRLRVRDKYERRSDEDRAVM